MRRAAVAAFAVAISIAVGCANNEGKAQDTKGEPPKTDAPKDAGKPDAPKADAAKPDGKDGEKPKVERHFKAKIQDRYKTPEFTLLDAVLFVPEVSLFGSSGGEAQRELLVKRGAAEISVPFEDIAAIDVGEEKEDRLELSIRFRDPEKTGKELRGTVRSSLELRGHFEGGKLKGTVKLREVKSVSLDEMTDGQAAPKQG